MYEPAHPQSDSQQYYDNCANTRARSTLHRLPPLHLALSLPSLPTYSQSDSDEKCCKRSVILASPTPSIPLSRYLHARSLTASKVASDCLSKAQDGLRKYI